ncbi:VOC family protein [Thalassiella azotivora]
MEQRVDFVTVATADLDAARAFYRDGLGWEPLLDVPGEILFLQVGSGLVLGLYDADAFAGDLAGAPAGSVEHGPPRGVTLSHNVTDEAAVDAAVERVRSAGGTVLVPPRRAAFGGYHAHVADPAGLVWEVAFNPGWRVAPDGRVELQAVDAPDDVPASHEATAPRSGPPPRSGPTPPRSGARAEPVIPDRSADDRDEGWGERAEDDDERWRREVPPHW